LVIVYLWKNAGYSSIIYLAAIAGIDKSVYEAASLDGATKLQQIFRITLPLLKPTVIIMTLMAVGRIFFSDFGLFYQVPMNSGALYATTQTIDTYVYRGLMELNDVGMSAAAGLFQSVLGFIIVVSANAFVRKVDSDNALF
ncbi:MAG: sugar ABC transporter permease, partial [Butyrivibrio sp.]|nr:sugar ABC transporter permease [Butyrivibrio sp.]